MAALWARARSAGITPSRPQARLPHGARYPRVPRSVVAATEAPGDGPPALRSRSRRVPTGTCLRPCSRLRSALLSRGMSIVMITYGLPLPRRAR